MNAVSYSKITFSDSSYPLKLKNYSGMPASLYFKGALPDPSKKSVAIVGARKCSSYGRQAAEMFARSLAEHGVQIISGLAFGIDSAAHEGCLKAGGATFAIMGCGIEHIYPRSNAQLYRRIIENNGGIISEFEPSSPPLAYHFPIRNRIISALSDAVVIIEAEKKSGSLITASYALEQGVQVYALPGKINDKLSCGTNDLIWQGAIPALSPEQILTDLGVNTKNSTSKKEESSSSSLKREYTHDELKLLELLSSAPLSLSELCYMCNMSTAAVSGALLSLELDGSIYSPFAGSYARTDR